MEATAEEEEHKDTEEAGAGAGAEAEAEEKKKPRELLTVTMELIRDGDDKIGPVVGYFPSSYNPLDKERHPEPPRVQLYRNVERSKRMEFIVNPAEAPVRFIGTNYSAEAALPQHVSYGVGVLDRKGKTLKIVPIAGGKIFRLEPRLKTEGIHDEDLQVKEEHSTEERYNQLSRLNTSYANKTTVKTTQHKTQLYQSRDVGVGAEVEEGILDKDALERSGFGISANIPPHNLLADSPEKAYPLDKIILKGDWVYLTDIWELWESKKKIKPDAYPSFVCNRSYKLDLVQDDAERKKMAGILSYITHMIKFRDQYSMDGFSSSRNHQFPRILSQKLTTMFVDVEKKRLSDGKQNLLTSYILVLTLHVDEFKTGPTDIARDLRTSTANLRKDYENLGCKFTRENDVIVATLPVPLKFKFAGKRRRRA